MLTACSGLALAGCGTDNATTERAQPGPTIERSTAERLAGRSDEVARLLEAGDHCEARAESVRLRDDLNAAINRRVIPEVYLEDLSGLVNEIQAQIPACEGELEMPPPASDEEKKRQEEEKKRQEEEKKRNEEAKKKAEKEKKRGKGGGEGDD